jgi:hypothetical protein
MPEHPFSDPARTWVPPDRRSDAPLAVDLSDDTWRRARPGRRSRAPAAWIGASAYVLGGVMLGLVLLGALALARMDARPSRAAAAAVVTDDVVRLRAGELDASCWRGLDRRAPARATLSVTVGVDGTVRDAAATGASPAMRACVTDLVRTWEFLPQATPAQVVLPLEVPAP